MKLRKIGLLRRRRGSRRGSRTVGMPRSIRACDSIAVTARGPISVGAVTSGFWLGDKLIRVALNQRKELFVNQEFRKELEARSIGPLPQVGQYDFGQQHTDRIRFHC